MGAVTGGGPYIAPAGRYRTRMAVDHACGVSPCPVQASLAPLLERGDPLPASAAGVPLPTLVPRCCTRCTLWGDRRLRVDAARVHRWALADAGRDVRALADPLHEARRVLKAGGPADETLARAARHLLDASRALAAFADGAEREALRPLFDEGVDRLARLVRERPDALEAVLGRDAPTVLPEEWDAYAARVAARVAAEGGAVTAEGDAFAVQVRSLHVRVAREGAAPADVADHDVVVTKRAPAALLADGRAPPQRVVVRIDATAPRVGAAGPAPAWLLRLLDARTDAQLEGELFAALTRGASAPLLTEPFITASEHEDAWPRGVVRATFQRLAERGEGTLREVAGVGLVLLID